MYISSWDINIELSFLLDLLNIGIGIGLTLFSLIASVGYRKNYIFFYYSFLYLLLISSPFVVQLFSAFEITLNESAFSTFVAFIFCYNLYKTTMVAFSFLNQPPAQSVSIKLFLLWLILIIICLAIEIKFFFIFCLIGMFYLAYRIIMFLILLARNNNNSKFIIIYSICYTTFSAISVSSYFKATAIFNNTIISLSDIGLTFLSLLLFGIFYSKNNVLKDENEKKIISLENEKLSFLKKQNEIIEVELNNRTKKLEDLIKIKNWYLGIISHDLRSPINEVILMLNKISKKTKNINFESQINKFQLINETFLLFLRWIESREKSPEIFKQKVPLKSTCDSLFLEFEEILTKKSISIINGINETVNIVYYQPFFETILRNTISNAIKYSFENSYIRIWNEESDCFQCVMIRDTGTGMDEKEIEEIFNTPTKKLGTYYETSTGFGLFICKDIVENLGGKMEISSKKFNGTTVKISFKKY